MPADRTLEDALIAEFFAATGGGYNDRQEAALRKALRASREALEAENAHLREESEAGRKHAVTLTDLYSQARKDQEEAIQQLVYRARFLEVQSRMAYDYACWCKKLAGDLEAENARLQWRVEEVSAAALLGAQEIVRMRESLKQAGRPNG